MKLGVWSPSACLAEGGFSKMGLGAIGGFPTMFSPPSCCQINRGAPILRASALHCGGDIQGASQLGRKIIFLKKWKKSRRRTPGFGTVCLDECWELSGQPDPGPVPAGLRSLLVFLTLEEGFLYIYIKILSSPRGCVLKRGLGTMRINKQIEN